MKYHFPMGYRADIDGLRGVAVLAVVAFHAFPSCFEGGFTGVDIFFVISGFLISTIIFEMNARRDFSFIEFYARRARRLFPALGVILAANCVFGWIYLLPDEYQHLGEHIAAGAAFVQNFVLWGEAGYFDKSAELKPLLHLWSLAVEEQFYLIYPIMVWALWRHRMNILIALVLLAGFSFALNITRVAGHPAEAFFLLHSRFWELLAGGILAYVRMFKLNLPYLTPARWRNALSVLGLLLISAGISVLDKDKAFPGWWALLPVLGTLLIISSGPHAWINRVVLGAPALSFLGRISYPLYLWHWTMLSFARIANPDVTALTRSGLIVISGLLAWSTYQYIEKPIRFGKSSLRRVSVGTASVLAAVGVVGLFVFQAQGVPSRLPNAIQALTTYKYDFSEALVGECWLSGVQPPNGFAQACYGNLRNDCGNGTVVIWGDSHAACLTPGVRAAYGDSWSVAQFTRDGCPPILGYNRAQTTYCDDNNKFVTSLLHNYSRSTVILFASWTNYSKDWTASSQVGKALLNTVRNLHDAGVDRVIVMGPSPMWKGMLPKLAINAGKTYFQNYTVPLRMNFGLDPNSNAVDKQFRSLLAGSPCEYISVFDFLCNDLEGCLVRTTNEQTSFTTWDYGHLTSSAARLVAGQLPIHRPTRSEH